MFRKLYKALYGLKRHERMLKVPRQYANRIDPAQIDLDTALIMGRSSARSPENVRALMKLHGVDRPHELIGLLPDQRYRANPVRRFLSLLRALTGALPYNPDARRYRLLKAKGYFSRPDLHARIDRIGEFK